MPRTPMTRPERLALACAALTGTVSGAVRAITAWLLNQITP
ncbi:hypothetical protein ABZV68_32270 [Streptomyces clavifer]